MFCIFCRDLKPENILLNDKMHIQITDFGSAKIIGKDDVQNEEKQSRDSGQPGNITLPLDLVCILASLGSFFYFF